jgi:hypothetical protein
MPVTPGDAMAERSENGTGIASATLEAARRSGMLALLVLLVILIFVVPALPLGDVGFQFVVDVLMTLILLIGLLAVAEHRRILRLLVVLSLVAILVRWLAAFMPSDLLPAMREVAELLALLVLAVAVGISVFGKGKKAADRIIGAVVLYLLIGLDWAVSYAIVSGFVPGAFAGGAGVAGHDVRHWVYFSFVTLTTVGYGDITPVARVAQSMAILEALVGQLYPAVILARLVSLPQESP